MSIIEKTISKSIKRLHELDDKLPEANAEEITGLTKKELLNLNRERDKLERALGGIKDILTTIGREDLAWEAKFNIVRQLYEETLA